MPGTGAGSITIAVALALLDKAASFSTLELPESEAMREWIDLPEVLERLQRTNTQFGPKSVAAESHGRATRSSTGKMNVSSKFPSRFHTSATELHPYPREQPRHAIRAAVVRPLHPRTCAPQKASIPQKNQAPVAK